MIILFPNNMFLITIMADINSSLHDEDKLPTYDEVKAAIVSEKSNNNIDCVPVKDGQLLGSDLTFMICLLIAFVFGIPGYCVAFCCVISIAGRSGCIVGIGLHMINISIIILQRIRYGDENDIYVERLKRDIWIVYIVLGLGTALFLHGTCIYIRAKRHVQMQQNNEINIV